jgi:hypothetical protein
VVKKRHVQDLQSSDSNGHGESLHRGGRSLCLSRRRSVGLVDGADGDSKVLAMSTDPSL